MKQYKIKDIDNYVKLENGAIICVDKDEINKHRNKLQKDFEMKKIINNQQKEIDMLKQELQEIKTLLLGNRNANYS